jgi:uncharacterized protein YciI
MLWAINCVDKPNSEAARAKVRDAHRDYLKGSKKVLLLSGATLSDEGEAIGVLYVIKAASRAEAQAWADSEPFTSGGVFASVKVTRMRKGNFNPEVAEGE